MKNKLLLFLFLFTLLPAFTQFECGFDNTFLMDATPSVCPGTSTINCINGGQYVTVNVTSGMDYTFSTCGNTAFDTQITVYDAPGTTVIGYNDDDCGVQSVVTWNATFTGTINVLVDEYDCQNTGACTDLAITCSPPVQSGDGCNTNTTICSPGLAGPFNFSTPGTAVSTCLDYIGPDYAYIVLYITQSGPLEMLIDGDAITGYLDVAVFNIPNGEDPCTAIQDNANEIGCSYAQTETGCNQLGQSFPCTSYLDADGDGLMEPGPSVNAGDVLFIVVENWSGESTNFTLNLAPVPAAQTGPPNATITPTGPYCSSDASVQLTAIDMGGTWTGTGVSSSGMFDPATAGAGTHTINYTIGSVPCDASSSTSITVNDCSNCYFDFISTNTGACETGSTFQVSGDFSYQDNPGTGTVIVEVTNSSGTWTQTFNPPFVDGTLYNYSIYADADGSAGTVTIYFSDDVACTVTQNITSPASCNCDAQIGTFTVSSDGNQVGNSLTLCFGDFLDITANGDYTPPAEATNPPNASGYDPGISWLVYTCPPTVALVPSTTESIPDDPCILTIASDIDLNELNDQWWINAYPGAFTDNIVYFVPITMYNMGSGTYSYVNTTLPCYELGAPFAVQFLPQVNMASTEDCIAGTVTATVSGGLPEIDGSNFTASNLLPATASFDNTFASNGGSITVSGLVDGDNYSFDIQDANGCPVSVSGTFSGVEDASFTYPQNTYCQNEPNPSPSITGVAGGTFSSTAGLSINPTSGLINLGTSTPGPYTVSYSTSDPTCFGVETFDLTIYALPIVNAGSDQSVCDGTNVTLSGSGANSYVWDNAVTDGVPFSQALGTITYTVIGTDLNGCSNTDQVDVTVNPNPTPVITGADEYCTGTYSTLSTTIAFSSYLWSTGDVTPTSNVTIADNPISVTVTNAFGCTGVSPTFTVSENSVINYNTSVQICQGESATIHGTPQSTAGIYSQTYTLPSGCDSTSNVTLIVNSLPTVDAGSDQTVCDGTQIILTASGAPTLVWDNAVVNGVPFTQVVGTVIYIVTGTDANGCENTDQVSVVVNALPVVSAGPDQTVCDGVLVTLSGSGASSYVWDNGAVDGVPFVSAIGTVTYTVIGTDANGCQDTDQVDVTVHPLPVVGAGLDEVLCAGESVTLFGSGATAYSWDNGVTDGLAFTPAVGNVDYTVTGTDANGCQNTDQVNVIVHALPNVGAGLDQTLCEGETIVLSGSGATVYDWDNGVVDGIDFTQIPGMITYTVTGTDMNGCENTDQVNVTVSPSPNINAGPDQTACSGTSVTLTANGANSYSWNYGVTNGVSFVPAVGTINYTVIGTDANGCTDTDQVVVTINPLPTVFAGNDVTICQGSQVILTGSGAQAYSWNNGVINGIGFIPSNSGTYNVTGVDANGCINSDAVVVTIESTPVIAFTADVRSGCAPLEVTFTNNSTGNLVNCIWTLSNGTVLNGCGSVTTTFQNGGSFNVTLTTTTANGCVGTDTYPNYIYVENVPIASFNPSSTTLTTLNSNVQFTNTSIGATNYEWTFGDGSAMSNLTHPDHKFPNQEAGTYLVTLVANSSLGCSDTTFTTITINEELIFYIPNTFTPDDDVFNDTFEPVFTAGFDPYDYTLYVFNRWGELIFESHDSSIGWDGTYGINGQEVADGVYVWKIEFKTSANDERKSIVGHVNILR